ncbi:hypothetical protein ASE26_03180 [Duganella sp. Root198D2]|nr:hypothetical protein ASD07_20995 [Duganella sp. Root336D2]KRB97055.1 hypothetical protein ASE26_03180 [Duganella sp. Root198D2]
MVYAGFALWVIPADGFSKLGLGERGQIGDTFGALNALFSSLGFAGILLTLYLQKKDMAIQATKDDEEVAERRSLFNLEASIQAYSQALGLLRDGNNHRATWIRAARILKHGKVLADAVTVDAHKRALELRLLDYRSEFRDILEHKPAEFFYGVDPRYYELGLDRVAALASLADANEQAHAMRWLDEKSVYAVLEASQWPDDYQDPLRDDLPGEMDIEEKTFFAQGLARYMEHRQQWHSIAGNLSPRNS